MPALVALYFAAIALSLLASPALGQGGPNPPPPMPFVRNAACENYCEPDWTACRTVTLRAEPRRDAPVVTRVPAGGGVTMVEGVSHTTRPGLVIFRGPMRHTQPKIDADGNATSDAVSWNFQPGDTVYVLSRESDGDGDETWTWYFRGRREVTYGPGFWAEWPEAAKPPGLLVRKPEQTWWVRLRTASGGTGWTAFESHDWTGVFPKYEDRADRCAK